MSPLNDDDKLFSRVAVLEDWRKEHRDDMQEIRASLAALTASVQALRLCNTPNLCQTIRAEIDEMTRENATIMRRMESLERWRTFISGVVATLGTVWIMMQVIFPWILKALSVVQ